MCILYTFTYETYNVSHIIFLCWIYHSIKIGTKFYLASSLNDTRENLWKFKIINKKNKEKNQFCHNISLTLYRDIKIYTRMWSLTELLFSYKIFYKIKHNKETITSIGQFFHVLIPALCFVNNKFYKLNCKSPFIKNNQA